MHILCIWLLTLAYKLHISAYFIAYTCILLLIQYLFLHILCMFLHICCLYHAYSCIVSMHIFAYFYIFWHFAAYLLHIHAFVCIFEHILILTMQHSTFIASAILHPGRPGHCPGVYVPPPAPIPCPRLWVTGPTIKVCSLSPHAEGDSSSVPHWNQWELGQDGCDGQNIQHLLVVLALIDHCRVHPINLAWKNMQNMWNMHVNRKYADICYLGVFFPYIPQEQRQMHSYVVSLQDRFVKQRRKGTTPCRTKHCPSLTGNHLCRCQVAGPSPYPDGWTFEAACPWRASSRHAAPLDTFCALSEE